GDSARNLLHRRRLVRTLHADVEPADIVEVPGQADLTATVAAVAGSERAAPVDRQLHRAAPGAPGGNSRDGAFHLAARVVALGTTAGVRAGDVHADVRQLPVDPHREGEALDVIGAVVGHDYRDAGAT